MLIIILIPLLVAAEWVEIAQNNYKKETYNTMTPLFEESTKKNTIYRNHSFSNPQWSKGYVHRVPSTGNVKRLDGIERKPSVKIERNPFFHGDLKTTEKPKRRFETNRPKSVKPVKVDKNNAYPDNVSHDQREYIRPASKIDFNRMTQTTPVRKLVFSDVMNNQNQNFRTTASQNINSERAPDTDKINLKTTYLDSKDPLETLQKDFKKKNEEKKFDEIKVEAEKSTTLSGTYKKDVRNKVNENKNGNEQKQTKTQNIKVNEKKTSVIETLTKFLNIVTQTINQSTRRSFKSKVRYLENLKNTLLTSIESRIDSAFPDDDTVEHRQRRFAGVESRGHVEVPSSESALMTISFLTFAVFLIKLVLQVIHTYKAKTMMMSPAVFATVGRGAAKMKKFTRN
ncbi:unnamed protein product [Parnassius apollo]|uniref:(apollo) hypothetical protein n=1 Tax=Parnassius apollo TaxID=110799 RepID=A0A8S3XC19_PARAO|nr:unnamed protein product [Parnassius apollo]